MISKYDFEFYLFTITSLIHTWDWALNAWTSVHTSRDRTLEGSREFRQLGFWIGGAPFNWPLCCGFSFLSGWENGIPGAEISQHGSFTLLSIFRGVVIGQRRLIFVHFGNGHWHRFDLERLEAAAWNLVRRDMSTLASGQAVVSEDTTRRENIFR
jgi:hypothetical protein